MRELVDRMLTLNANQRASINDILGMPIMKARIARFLSQTLQV